MFLPSGRLIPQRRHVVGERHKHRTLVVANFARQLVVQAPDLFLEQRDRRQMVIPSPFELAGDQTVIGINGVVLAACMRHLIAGLVQGDLALPEPFRCRPACDRKSTATADGARRGAPDATQVADR